MRILIYGAGPLGSLYAHLLHQAGKDVTILARDERYSYIKERGIITTKIFQKILNTKFAEIGFAMHAKAALDERKQNHAGTKI